MLQSFILIRLVCGGRMRVLLNWTVFCVRSSSITRYLSHATSVLTSIACNSRSFPNQVQYRKPFLSIFAVARPFVSDSDSDNMSANRFACDYARLGTSSCKNCRQKLEKGCLRLAKLTVNPYSDGADTKQYFHPRCLFETFLRARSTTKVIEHPDDVEGLQDLKDEDKVLINDLIKDLSLKKGSSESAECEPMDTTASDAAESDNSFHQFQKLCAELSQQNGHNLKTDILETYITKGSTGDGFQGDLYLVLKLLLAKDIRRVYNLESKRLAKHFSQIFKVNPDEMIKDLENGDVSETVKTYFKKCRKCRPQAKSTLSLQEVDGLLGELSQYTHEEDQQKCLERIAKRCTADDLKMIVRLIKHDLRIGCGSKIVLDALDPDAHAMFLSSKNLKDVIDQVMQSRKATGRGGKVKKLSIQANLMTPVQPMLAEACKSVEQAFKKCPNGMYAEIKYDGERVQVHKQGNEFLYFSRSLKPVQQHKVKHVKDFIPKAFPNGTDLILDSEVLLIDTKTGKPLPFGSLGIHKQTNFENANVCLFVFDCLHYNGQDIMKKPITERRRILCENMLEIPNRILISEMKQIDNEEDLGNLMMDVFHKGLEGLVLKDSEGIYEPGKRRWLKVKKDYVEDGKMADSVDLVILGAYFGTGKKGGVWSSFLMGVHDSENARWCTVTKCGNGFDDESLEMLQNNLHMVKISKDFSKVPAWLKVSKTCVPDLVIANPKKSQVLEITGAQFSESDCHTAAGISIRFPRCTKLRDDKSWKEATDLKRLKELYAKSKKKREQGKKADKESDDEDSEDDDSDKPSESLRGKRKAAGDPTASNPAKKGKK